MDPNVSSIDEETSLLLKSLSVEDKEEPFSQSDIEESARKTAKDLEKWRLQALSELRDLKELINNSEDGAKLSVADRARIIATSASFDEGNEEGYIPAEISSLAQQCLTQVTPTDQNPVPKEQWRETISQVLRSHIKPLFLPSLHPSINLETGRKRARPMGGPNATHDLYDDQPWKKTVSLDGANGGCWNTVRWCVNHADASDYETLWPGLIPPIMTMMDDYQPIFRIRAIRIVKDLLMVVDSGLLKRTGIDTLFSESLKTALTYFTSSETPIILREAVPCTQLLIEKTTSPNSKERFDQICDLIKRAVVGGVWVYASDKVDAMVASVQILPPLLRALRIGSIRFLKALIPQLSDNLVTKPYLKHSHELQLASANCLVVVIQECSPRIVSWKGRILNGLIRSWIRTKEDGKVDPGTPQLQKALKELYVALIYACPPVIEREIRILQDKDSLMFEELLALN